MGSYPRFIYGHAVWSTVHAAAQSNLHPDLRDALRALQEGRPILIFDDDDREGETDLFFPAQHATPEAIGQLRSDAGGLVFVALGPEVHEALGLPFLHDVLREAAGRWDLLEDLVPAALPYDARSSFSLTINHRKTFTGITDEDRALTVSALGKLASLEPCLSREALRDRFVETFRTPGHVHICSAAPDLLTEREGHTELAVTLARMAGIPEAVVGAEILDGPTAMTTDDARELAKRLEAPMVTGTQIKAGWQSIEETPDHIGVQA